MAELKEELEARDELKTGNKAWLRRRLHGAIVRVHLEAAGAETSIWLCSGRSEGTRGWYPWANARSRRRRARRRRAELPNNGSDTRLMRKRHSQPISNNQPTRVLGKHSAFCNQSAILTHMER